jgi:hypothetical protein
MVSGNASLILALVMGFAFGWLLHRGKVTNCNVIENQFRLRDFTMLKVMFPAIVIGGVGVMALIGAGEAQYHIKDANLLGVSLGAALFGVALVFYGYCPGTGIAAIATGSVHALVGTLGMIAGAIVYALTYDWVKSHILNVWALGKVRLPDITGAPDAVWFLGLAIAGAVLFYWVEQRARVP